MTQAHGEYLVEEDSAREIALAPRTADAAEVLGVASECAAKGVRIVMATVLDRRGSTPATPGQKLVLAADGTCVGTVGGGALERAVLAALLQRLDARGEPGAERATYRLGASLGMCCGGTVEMLLETLAAARAVLVVGAGHVGQACAPLLARCGFTVTLVDERDAWIERATATLAGPRLRCLAEPWDEAGRALPRDAAVIAMTHDHQRDQEVVAWALREGFAFVGGVGSRAKHARTLARLEARGVSAEDRARVRMPIGLDIGARTPDEIAVSIAAELIRWRRTP
jgi:xanthine dehydrogenase accessory factor